VIAQLDLIFSFTLSWFRIGVNQRGQGTAPNCEPCDKSPKLRRGEDVDFKHGHRVRANGAIPELVHPEFGDCGGGQRMLFLDIVSALTFPSNALPELTGILGLLRALLEVVNVYVTNELVNNDAESWMTLTIHPDDLSSAAE
jgi:hypothetical protein